MAISFTKYIDIVSGIGAANVVSTRDLIGRLFTTNPLLPTGSYIEFESAEDVGNYFGTSSEEYLRAVFYFGWISKNITAPQKIAYARWVDADVAPRIYGERITTSLVTFTAITTGSFRLTLGGVVHNIPALDFSGAGSLTAVAAIIQAGIRTQTGTQWTAATVTYNASRGSFDFVGGSAVVANVIVQAGTTGTNIATLMGWVPEAIGASTGAIWSDGALTETITDTLIASSSASNNFGSFLFIPTLTQDEIVEAATWNAGQNVFFMFMVRAANLTDAQAYSVALLSLAGTAITLAPLSTEYPEQIPMMVLAATAYDKRNSTQNYMFQIFNLTPSVTTTADSDTYDALRVNYYGQTQTAGQLIQFYQRGFLTGLAVNPQPMNIYANEQWLRDAMGSALMTLLLSLAKISANASGRSQIMAVIQSVVNQALFNNTISVHGVLSTQQKLYIADITGDQNAWYQVQNIGYWADCVIEQYTNSLNSLVEYKALYTLVYKKDDVVNKIEGSHVLI